jgi:hypothetical protein
MRLAALIAQRTVDAARTRPGERRTALDHRAMVQPGHQRGAVASYSWAVNVELGTNGLGEFHPTGRRVPSGRIRISVGAHGVDCQPSGRCRTSSLVRSRSKASFRCCVRCLASSLPHRTRRSSQLTCRERYRCEPAVRHREGHTIPADFVRLTIRGGPFASPVEWDRWVAARAAGRDAHVSQIGAEPSSPSSL